jgi:dihydropteroate synthase-like protein
LRVASEVYARAGARVEDVASEALRRLSEGADMVVIGVPAVGGDTGVALRAVEKLSDAGVTVGIDAAKLEVVVEGLERGAALGLSLTRRTMRLVPRRLREEKVFVVIPESMGHWRVRVRELLEASRAAWELGYSTIILDPVMNPPVSPGSLESLIAARELSEASPHPIMLGVNNFYELVDADTHSSLVALTSLAVEAGVSIVLVSEESSKALGATFEARIASDMASLAARWRCPPKDLWVNALLVKAKRLESPRTP